jgi:hypothetical protein
MPDILIRNNGGSVVCTVTPFTDEPAPYFTQNLRARLTVEGRNRDFPSDPWHIDGTTAGCPECGSALP